jgi:hypothetical protein
MEKKKVYIGVYDKENLFAVMEWLSTEQIDTDTIDTFHDCGYILKTIKKEEYLNFIEKSGLEWEDIDDLEIPEI